MADLTEAIEAGAEAIWDDVEHMMAADDPEYVVVPWHKADVPYVVSNCRQTAQTVLEAAAPIIERQVRAEIAEGIAQAIEAKARIDKHGVTAWVYGWRDGLDEAAATARGYTSPAGPGQDRDGSAPAQPTQGRVSLP